MDTIIEVKGEQIPRELKKLYSRESEHLFSHMLNAIKDKNLLPHLVLRVEKEGAITTARLFDVRTNENIV